MMSLQSLLVASWSCGALSWSMPKFSWDTLPVGFHSSNPGGPYSDDQLKNISKFSTVAFEKWQGLHHYPEPGYNWETCQPLDDPSNVSKCGCCIEDEMIGMGKRLKAMNPEIQVIEYLNSQQAYPWYRLGHEVAARPGLWLRDTDGEIVKAGAGHWIFPDLAQKEAQELWYNNLINVTKTGFIDGVFVDGCDRGVKNTAKERQIGKIEMLKQLQKDIPGILICGSNGHVVDGLGGSQIQNWGKGEHWSTREIPMLQKAVKAGIMFQAHGACLRDMTQQTQINDLAAFLIAAGPFSYYVCGGWNSAPTEWFEVYDRPLGEPLTDAVLSVDGVWSRSFKRGVSVTFDTNIESGNITWGPVISV